MIRIILIRHGQTAWNAGAGEERFRGHTDLPLDATGQAQARAVATRLRDEPLAALYASPLLRAKQTLAPLADERSLSIQPHPGLLDIDYGRLQGLTHEEAQAAYPALYRTWRTAPGRAHFPGGETCADVQARLVAMLVEVTARHTGETIALVGHQIVNKILICTLLGIDLDRLWTIGQGTAAINVFEKADDAWHILSLNDTCHLS